jgi:hypothetical protein
VAGKGAAVGGKNTPHQYLQGSIRSPFISLNQCISRAYDYFLNAGIAIAL